MTRRDFVMSGLGTGALVATGGMTVFASTAGPREQWSEQSGKPVEKGRPVTVVSSSPPGGTRPVKPDPQFGKPAPRWLQEAEVYDSWYWGWTDEIIGRRLRGLPLVIGVPHSKEWVDKAHEHGIHVLAYVSFYQAPKLGKSKGGGSRKHHSSQGGGCISLLSPFWREVNLDVHPEWILVKEDGQPRRPFEEPVWPEGGAGYPAMLEQACPNSPGYQEAALRGIAGLLDLGLDGIMIDNVLPQYSDCFGPQSGRHPHVHPEKTREQAYLDLLARAYEMVKQRGSDKVILLNGNVTASYLLHSDGGFKESYVCSKGRDYRARWSEISDTKDLLWPVINSGKVIAAISTLGKTPYPVEEDAYYTYACARVSGFIWGDFYTLPESSPAQVLFRVRLGQSAHVLEGNDRVLFRRFERGFVAVNSTNQEQEFRIQGADGELVDLFEQRRLRPVDGAITYRIPAESGRVYCREEAILRT